MSHPPQQPQLPPPKKRNGPLIGLLAAGGGLLLVVAVLFTGLVAPGFFLSEHEPPSRTTTPLDLNSGSVAAGKFLLAVMSDDQAAAEAAACATGKTQVLEAARKLGASNAQLTAGDPVQTFENRMRIDLSGTIGSRKVSGELSVKRETDGNYCVSGVIAPS
jgi:hypothetical protein